MHASCAVSLYVFISVVPVNSLDTSASKNVKVITNSPLGISHDLMFLIIAFFGKDIFTCKLVDKLNMIMLISQ